MQIQKYGGKERLHGIFGIHIGWREKLQASTFSWDTIRNLKNKP